MTRIVRLVPFLLFRLGLFPTWRLIPRRLRKQIVERIAPPPPRHRRRLPRPVGPLILVGLLRSSTGFGWVARFEAALAREAGLTTYGIDVAEAFAAEDMIDAGPIENAPRQLGSAPGTLLIFLNPEQFGYAAAFQPPEIFENKYVIGHCAWELERIPEAWREPLTLLDEIWVPSQFAREAFRNSGVTIPCRVVPHAFTAPAQLKPDRARFGIDAEAFVVLTAFTLRSGLERKNPMAAIRAFLKAFPHDPGTRLVLKVSDTDIEPESWERLRKTVAGNPRIIVLTELFSDLDMWALIASVDVVLSTHRAEAFGIVPAQAMLCGRVAVATGWSGNVDYMEPQSSILLPYTLKPVHDPSGNYVVEGTRWAEVDEDATAGALARLRADPAGRDELARRGKAHIEALFARQRGELLATMRDWVKPG